MKTPFPRRLTAVLLTFAALSISGAAAAAEPEISPRDITHGNVRAVLMSVSQTTVFPNAADKAGSVPHGGTSDSVPCFTVTVLVEALGAEPFKKTSAMDVQVLSDGKPRPFVNSRGSYHQDFDYRVFQGFLDFSKPKVTNPKRAFIRRYVQFGAVPNLKPFDLLIKVGFDADIQSFEFPAISLK